jgi:hypothetical protein
MGRQNEKRNRGPRGSTEHKAKWSCRLISVSTFAPGSFSLNGARDGGKNRGNFTDSARMAASLAGNPAWHQPLNR